MDPRLFPKGGKLFPRPDPKSPNVNKGKAKYLSQKWNILSPGFSSGLDRPPGQILFEMGVPQEEINKAFQI
jgi:hypothetical protein